MLKKVGHWVGGLIFESYAWPLVSSLLSDSCPLGNGVLLPHIPATTMFYCLGPSSHILSLLKLQAQVNILFLKLFASEILSQQ